MERRTCYSYQLYEHDLLRSPSVLRLETRLSEAETYEKVGDLVSMEKKRWHYEQCLKIYHDIGDHVQALRCYYKCRMTEGLPLRRNILEEAGLKWDTHALKFPDEVILDTTNEILRSVEKFPDGISVIRHVRVQIYLELSVAYELLMTKSKAKIVRDISRDQLEYTLQRANMCFSSVHLGSEVEDCNIDSEEESEHFSILSLWARLLREHGKPEFAMKRVLNALTSSLDKHHERKSLQCLDGEMESNDKKCSSIDFSWIKGTNITIPEKQKARQQEVLRSHKKKEKRSRPKRMEEERSVGTTEREIANDTAEASQVVCHLLQDENDSRQISRNGTTKVSDSRQNGDSSAEVQNEVHDEFDVDVNKDKTNAASDLKSNPTVTMDRSHSKKNKVTQKPDVYDDCGKDISIIYRRRSVDEVESDSENSESEFSPDSTPINESDEDSSEDEERNDKFEASVLFYEENHLESSFLDYEQIKNGIDLDQRVVDNYMRKSKKNDYYKPLLSKEHSKRKLSENPKYKKCRIRFEGAHRAICLNLDPGDEVTEIEISGRSKCRKVFNGDIVVVEILNFERVVTTVIPRLKRDINENNKSNKINGEVIGCLERKSDLKHPVMVCTLDESTNDLLKPLCKTVPKLKLHKERKNDNEIPIFYYNEVSKNLDLEEDMEIDPAYRSRYVFLAAYICWSGQYPIAAVIKVFKPSDDISSALRNLRLVHKVPTLYQESTVKHTAKILDDFKKGVAHFFSANDRLDLSNKIRTYTIDPPNSCDLDDALSVEFDGDVHYTVGVHISDVSVVVKKDDPVDREARERATTFFTGRRNQAYHMLPEPLSNQICSLLPNERRPTISIFFKMNKDGFILRHPVIRKTIIKSTQRFSYNEVQKIIDAEKAENDIKKDIKLLSMLSSLRRKIRLNDAFHWFPIECPNDGYMDSLDAHHLVEEFMILANFNVALMLISDKQVQNSVILRCQDYPSLSQILKWKKINDKHIIDTVFKIQGMKCKSDGDERFSFNNVGGVRWRNILSTQTWVWNNLEKAFRENDLQKMKKWIGTDELHPLQCLALKEWEEIQENAEYRHAEYTDGLGKGRLHFSLGMFPYVHFTSPIRRYTDLVIHRLVHVLLKGSDEQCRYLSDEIQEICSDVNEVSQQARSYQKSCEALSSVFRFRSKPYLTNTFVKDFTESKIVLTLPSIKNVPIKHREIPLCLLHTSSNPSITKKHDKSVMTLTWSRRIYHRNGSKSVQNNPYVGNFGLLKKLNPHLRSEFVQIIKWRDLSKAILEENWEIISDIMKENEDREETEYMRIKDKLVWTYVEECINTDSDVSSETLDGDLMHHYCHHSMTIVRGQIVSVQLSPVVYKGVFTLSPQLLNISQNSRLCLQHMQNPVQFLSRYSTVRTKSEGYKNVSEYLEIWLPILEMEFASRAVMEDSPTINAVPVHFTGKRGSFELRKWFSDERQLVFRMMSRNLILNGKVNEDEEEDATFENSDFICIRCDMPEGLPPGNPLRSDNPKCRDYIWVGHAQIQNVNIVKKERHIDSERRRKESDKEEYQENTKQWTRMLRIEFVLHKESCLPSPQMQQQGFEPKCCIELIQRSTPDKRVATILKCLPYAIPLAQAIALGKRTPKLNKDHIIAAEKINVNKPMGNLKQNNNRQREALEKALKKSFSLIQGPPGTGKTTTGIKLINCFHELNRALSADGERKQIIFCGQSNKSVDLVAKMYRRKFPESNMRLIRLYGTLTEYHEFPVPGRLANESASAKNSKPDPELSDISMHKIIRSSDNKFRKAIKEYDRKFKDYFEAQERKKEKMRDILMHAQKREKQKFFNEMRTEKSANKASVYQDIHSYNSLITEAIIQELKSSDVIFCTTSVAASPNCLQALHGRVSQLIIDECGLCTEAESIATIIATKPTQVVLIGDHKQLQPFVTCREAADLGLEKSLFERYTKKSAFTFLNEQYRMHPEICKLPSRLFYENKLETGNPDASSNYQALSLWPRKDVPHLFIHVEGEEELMAVTNEKGNVRSCSNKAEVKQVMKLFRRLWKNEKVCPNDINLMSQYNAQCSAIRDALEEELALYNSKMPTHIDVNKFVNSNVNTVVGSQGAEWDYVIFTTARSLPKYRIEHIPTRGWKTENLGFTTDEHQINVALTRAKRGLFIVGNKNLLGCDGIWKALISEYYKQGCVVNGNNFSL